MPDRANFRTAEIVGEAKALEQKTNRTGDERPARLDRGIIIIRVIWLVALIILALVIYLWLFNHSFIH